ncbi:hypothetical protein ACH41E_07775 [Streptomyces sp. NPDC020412]|uniref:hypothetical protein n=1 Tax=Streptomyces sp. NPDC020412 TaxID=3365073 RepID=UPI0037A6D968
MRVEPEYRALFAVDIERSAGRGDSAFLEIRHTLLSALRESFGRSGIDWDACLCTDLGDGIQVTAPAGLWKTKLIHPLIHELDARLHAHNRLAGPLTRIRVRIALHAGDVHLHPDGQVVGRPLEVLARLLNAAPTRVALNRAPDAVTALIVSQHFHEETVCHGYPGIEPAAFHGVTVTEKEYVASAWLHVPGQRTSAPAPEEAARPPATADTTEGPRTGAPVRPETGPGPGPGKMRNKAKGNGSVYAVQNGTQNVRVTDRRT